MHSKINIAIDGFSGCGKSTLAKDLAKEIGYIFIDSGAMYRAVTLFALRNNYTEGETLNASKLINALDEIEIAFVPQKEGAAHTYLNNQDVEREIRKPKVSSWVSQVAALPEVRTKLVALQQEMGQAKGVVMDGRDIGTAVFPDAELKLFITASMEERTNRRFLELQAKGIEASKEEIAKNLAHRDYLDSNREMDPLRQADDAILIDNTCLTKKEQLTLVRNKYKKCLEAL